jgi:hypothetical protein
VNSADNEFLTHSSPSPSTSSGAINSTLFFSSEETKDFPPTSSS